MYNSKLFKVLQNFSKKEWKQFRRYLLFEVEEQSEIVQLYDHIFQYRSNLAHKKLSLDYANDLLFKRKTKANFRNLISRIYFYALDYLALTYIKSEEETLRLYRTLGLQKKQLYEFAENEVKSLEAIVAVKPVDIWDSWTVTRANHALKFSNHRYSIPRREYLLKHINQNWSEFKKTMDYFYLLDAGNDKNIWHFEAGDFITALEESIDTNQSENRTIQILENVLKLNKAYTEDVFEYLYEVITQDNSSLSFNVAYILLFFCIGSEQSRIAIGKQNDLNRLYELYHVGLETGLMLHHGKMNQLRFYVISHVVNLVKGYDQCENWISKWSHVLLDKTKEETLSICQMKNCIVHFKAEKAIDLINQTDIQYPVFQRSVRLDLLYCYLMIYKDDYDFIERHILNFQKYLDRNKSKMSERALIENKNTLKILYGLLKGKSRNELLKELAQTEIVYDRYWLRLFLEK